MTAIEPIAAKLLTEALDAFKSLDANRANGLRQILDAIDKMERDREADRQEVERMRNEARALMTEADDKEADAFRAHRAAAAIRDAIASQVPPETE